MLLIQVQKCLHILVMQLLNVFLGRIFISLHSDWSAHDHVGWASVRHQPEAVLKDASAVEQGRGEGEDLLEPVLELTKGRSFRIGSLIVEKMLPKGKDWDQITAIFEGQLNEALSFLQHQRYFFVIVVESFSSSSNDYGSCFSTRLPRQVNFSIGSMLSHHQSDMSTAPSPPNAPF